MMASAVSGAWMGTLWMAGAGGGEPRAFLVLAMGYGLSDVTFDRGGEF